MVGLGRKKEARDRISNVTATTAANTNKQTNL